MIKKLINCNSSCLLIPRGVSVFIVHLASMVIPRGVSMFIVHLASLGLLIPRGVSIFIVQLASLGYSQRCFEVYNSS